MLQQNSFEYMHMNFCKVSNVKRDTIETLKKNITAQKMYNLKQQINNEYLSLKYYN